MCCFRIKIIGLILNWGSIGLGTGLIRSSADISQHTERICVVRDLPVMLRDVCFPDNSDERDEYMKHITSDTCPPIPYATQN